jgi:hypothetical protein
MYYQYDVLGCWGLTPCFLIKTCFGGSLFFQRYIKILRQAGGRHNRATAQILHPAALRVTEWDERNAL